MNQKHPLRIVRPLAVTPSMVVWHNVPENDYPAWSAGTTYGVGARVIVPALHKVYESSQAGNVGHVPQGSPGHWSEVGATNAWKVFDASVSTQTRRATSIGYLIRPGQAVHAVGALNLVGATHIQVRVIDPILGVIYDRVTQLAGHLLNSTWWDWFFGPRTQPTQSIHLDLPAAPAADIEITVTGTDELAVGVLVLGQLRTFAVGVRLGARVGITDWSRKDRNDWGDTILVERPFARRATFPLLLRSTEVDSFVDEMTRIRAIPCLWIGASPRYEAMAIYGIYKSFDVVLSRVDYSECDLELEGLT